MFSRFGDLKPIFGKLTPEETYDLLMTFMSLTFIFGVFGLVCWVYVNNQKRESRVVRTGLLVLLALAIFGIAAWAMIGQTSEHISQSLGPQGPHRVDGTSEPTRTVWEPPDLEAQKWKVHIRSSDFPAFEGQIEFRADRTFDAMGKFLVPTQAANQHLDCPGELTGHWDSKNPSRSVPIIVMNLGSYGDSGISKDEYLQCSATLKLLALQKPSTTCTFTSANSCQADKFDMRLY